MPPAKRRTNRFISGHGALCTVSAVFFLAEGLLRGELAAAICGAAFLAYALFALVAVFTGAFFSRQLELSPEWIRPGTIRIHHAHLSSAHTVSGFFCETAYSGRFTTDPERRDARSFTVLALLSGTRTISDITVPPRGRYYPAEQDIVIRDYARFFSISLSRTAETGFGPLTVPPVPAQPAVPAIPEGKTGCARGKSTFRRSEELYESRSYSPGDDPRRINWKLFAHTGTLSLRQGELLPPPSNELILLFNTAIPERWGSKRRTLREAEARYDGLIARAASIAESLLRQNKNLVIHTTNADNRAVLTKIGGGMPSSRAILLDALAAPHPCQHTAPVADIIAQSPETATFLLFSLPDQPLDIHALLPFRNRLAVYIGPQQERLPLKTIRETLKTALTIDSQSPGNPSPRAHPDPSPVVSALNEAGLHASKI